MTTDEYNIAVKEYANRLCRFADKLLLDTDTAKDITQEAFLKLWENKNNINGSKVKAWLFTTTYRLCIDHIQRRKKITDVTPGTEPSVQPENPDLKDIINYAFSLLPPIQRSVLLMRDYEGYNYQEIGEILELNESQVKVYLFRARQKIKDHIKDLKLVL